VTGSVGLRNIPLYLPVDRNGQRGESRSRRMSMLTLIGVEVDLDGRVTPGVENLK
jgi:hypothetical protein